MDRERGSLRQSLVGLAGILLTCLAAGASAATFVVDSTADSVDVHPGDGVCADAQARCTLRAAVMEADALAGADLIDLTGVDDPNTPVILSLPGSDETYVETGGDPAWVVGGAPDPSIGDLDITDSLTVHGAGPDKTVIEWPASVKTDPATGDRIFHIQTLGGTVNVTISGLSVRNGVTPTPIDVATTPEGLIWKFKRHGAGIAIGAAASMELVDPTLDHGKCGSGGGHGGGHGGEGEDCGGETGINTVLMDVWLLDNQSGGDGGGLYNAAPLTLGDSFISGNSAKSKGGGIYNGAELTMFGTTIGTAPGYTTPNTAKHGGGMFDGAFHQSYINSSAFIGNQAQNGGGIAGRRRVLMYLVNTTVSGNTAAEAGGGIITNGQAVLHNVTIADNVVTTPEAANVGAGIDIFAMGSFTFVNTLFANNTLVGDTPQLSSCGWNGEVAYSSSVMSSLGHNLADDDSCFLDPAKGDLAGTDAMLGALADNGGPTYSYALPMGSPAVDAGTLTQCPNNDQRGGLRPADGNLDGGFDCDIGAYELFVHTADLHVEDMQAPDRVFTSDSFTVQMTVHNDPGATATATAVTIGTDPLPPAFHLAAASITTPSGTSDCTLAGSAVTCDAGDLGVGEGAVMRLSGSAASPGELTVTGNVSSTSPIDPVTANNAGHVHVLAIGQSDLVASATDVGGHVDVGSLAVVPFTISNDGPDAASHLRLLVSFGGGLTYVSTSLPGDCTVGADDGSLLCQLDDLAPGASLAADITVRADAETRAAIDFALDADQRETDVSDASASVTLDLWGLNDLSLETAFAPAEAAPGTPVPLQFRIHNAGPAAADTTTFSAVLPAGLSYAGTSSACTATGQKVVCEISGIAAGTTVAGSFLVQATDPGNYSVSATVDSVKTDPASADNATLSVLSVDDAVAAGASSGGGTGGGGCAYDPYGHIDPLLPLLLVLAFVRLCRRRGYDRVRPPSHGRALDRRAG